MSKDHSSKILYKHPIRPIKVAAGRVNPKNEATPPNQEFDTNEPESQKS